MGVCCEPQDMEVATPKTRVDLKILAPDFELRKQVNKLFQQQGLSEDDGMPMEKAIPILKDLIA